MKVKDLQSVVDKMNPDEEVAVEIITEQLVWEEAKLDGTNLTPASVRKIVRAIDDREDNRNAVVEHYIRLLFEGGLDDEEES